MSPALLELMARVITHIPDNGDLTLVILKGHLIVEEEVNTALAARASVPNHLRDAKLEFDQLLSITKAFYFKEEHGWVWGGIKKLNSIRNLLAHNMEPPDLGARINEFLELVEGHINSERDSTAERLRRCIAMLAAQVHHLYRKP